MTSSVNGGLPRPRVDLALRFHTRWTAHDSTPVTADSGTGGLFGHDSLLENMPERIDPSLGEGEEKVHGLPFS